MLLDRLDAIDNEILSLLYKNARLSYSDIGSKVRLSRTAVKNRISALEKSGVISGYRALIHLDDSPQMTTYVVNIEAQPEHFEKIRDTLIAEPQAITVVQTTGNCHLLAICIASGHQSMRDFLNRTYKDIPGIVSITANTVIDISKGTLLPDSTIIEVRKHEKDNISTISAK